MDERTKLLIECYRAFCYLRDQNLAEGSTYDLCRKIELHLKEIGHDL